MSAIHAKIASAKAKAEKNQAEASAAPQGGQTLRPPLPQRPIATTDNWNPKRSRGRPRKLITKEHLTLPAIEPFVRECLIQSEGSAEFIGSTVQRNVRTVTGSVVRAPSNYPRITLADAYIEFAKDRGYVPTVPRSFVSLLITTCLAAGWVVSESSSSEWRRRILRGVCLRNQLPWSGDDRGMGRPDRKRWIAKTRQ